MKRKAAWSALVATVVGLGAAIAVAVPQLPEKSSGTEKKSTGSPAQYCWIRAIASAMAAGGSATPMLCDFPRSRFSVAAASRSGSASATSPRSLQATPQAPIAVGKSTWWILDDVIMARIM